MGYKKVTEWCSLAFFASTLVWLGLKSYKRGSVMVAPYVTLVLSQGVGLYGLLKFQDMVFNNWLCSKLGPDLGNVESFWYTCSDLALMYLLATYFVSHEKPYDSSEGRGAEEGGYQAFRDDKEEAAVEITGYGLRV